MGTYRLILAMLVALSHANVDLKGYNLGVVAVVSFYILSGYVMTVLIEKYYKNSASVMTFYLDRTARLFPQFLFYAALSAIVIYGLPVQSTILKDLTFSKLLIGFLMIPNGFFMFWGGEYALIIPQSWSLGLETTFYIAIPWILIALSRRQTYWLAGASLFVFALAYCGVVNTDYFGYRLLPGTLFMFLVGTSFCYEDVISRRFRLMILVVAAILYTLVWNSSYLHDLHFSKEILIGLLLGIPVIGCLKELQFSQVDEFLGNLSYGVFLNHFVVIWIVKAASPASDLSLLNIVEILVISTVGAFASFMLIERPALRWRHRLRHRRRLPTIKASSTPEAVR